ncbi:MAG: hypothetical protein DMG00_27395 [Acidobacteria bacterium]|nr:MAG: hypothetical protein DMG00_27395 [Acidobacteriota bacterium]
MLDLRGMRFALNGTVRMRSRRRIRTDLVQTNEKRSFAEHSASAHAVSVVRRQAMRTDVQNLANRSTELQRSAHSPARSFADATHRAARIHAVERCRWQNPLGVRT